MEGFYKTNIKVLQFDVNKEIDEIRFNHYISRKENFCRISKQLELGNFELSASVVEMDLKITNSKAKRLIKKFIDLGIITVVYKSNSKGKASIYNYATYSKNEPVNELVFEPVFEPVSEPVKTSNINGSSGITEPVSEPVDEPVSEPVTGPSKKDNKINNKKDNKIFYMDLSFIDDCITDVKITEEEYKNLIEKYPKKLVHDKIEALEIYKDMDKYDSHYKVLNNWCKKDKDKEEYKEKPKRRPKKDPYASVKGDCTEDKYAYLKPKDPPAWVVDWT